MQKFYIIINPTGRMQSLTLPDSLYDMLDFADFDIKPIKNSDIRVRNLDLNGNVVEMPREQFEVLQGLVKLYHSMHDTLQQYVAISSQSLINFLIRGILSFEFEQQMPAIFQQFPRLITAYQQKILLATPSIQHRRELVALRAKFVIGVLEAYFEQDFVISSASLSQEKFANASFFDGSTEFKIDVTIDKVLMPIENSYEFSPITLSVAGTYSMIDGYHFETEHWQVEPDFKKYFDAVLFENKQAYLDKIVSQSHTDAGLDDFMTCLRMVAEQFRQAEEQRHEGLPK